MSSDGKVSGNGHSPTCTELVWTGERTQVNRISLPFQVVETVNQSHANREQPPAPIILPQSLLKTSHSKGPPLATGRSFSYWPY